MERKTMEERKNIFPCSLNNNFKNFLQSPANYIAGPDPSPFHSAINKLSVPLGIFCKLKPQFCLSTDIMGFVSASFVNSSYLP